MYRKCIAKNRDTILSKMYRDTFAIHRQNLYRDTFPILFFKMYRDTFAILFKKYRDTFAILFFLKARKLLTKPTIFQNAPSSVLSLPRLRT